MPVTYDPSYTPQMIIDQACDVIWSDAEHAAQFEWQQQHRGDDWVWDLQDIKNYADRIIARFPTSKSDPLEEPEGYIANACNDIWSNSAIGRSKQSPTNRSPSAKALSAELSIIALFHLDTPTNFTAID